MLTPSQRKCLVFIEGYQERTRGVSPTLAEIAATLKLSSKGHAHGLLRGLEERGFIRRIPHRSRAIEVLKPVSVTAFFVVFQNSKGEMDLRPHIPQSDPRNAEPRQIGPGSSGVLKSLSDGKV